MTPETLGALAQARAAGRPVVLATRLPDGLQRLLPGRDAPPALNEPAARALARRHPFLQRLLVPVTHRLMRYRTMHYELLWDREAD